MNQQNNTAKLPNQQPNTKLNDMLIKRIVNANMALYGLSTNLIRAKFEPMNIEHALNYLEELSDAGVLAYLGLESMHQRTQLLSALCWLTESNGDTLAGEVDQLFDSLVAVEVDTNESA